MVTVAARLSLACYQGESLELGLRTTATFHETTCLVVLRKEDDGVGFRSVEEPTVVANQVAVVARRASWDRNCLCATSES